MTDRVRSLGLAALAAVGLAACELLLARPPETLFPDTLLTTRNNQIQFPHFSFVAPAGQGWRLLRLAQGQEVARIVLELGAPTRVSFLMQFIKMDVRDDRMRSAPARQAADDYRTLEQRTMVEQGVRPGRYRLVDLVMGEETIGAKTFYTMTYGIVANTYAQTARLYLHFPKDEGNDFFILVHYSRTLPPGAATTLSSERDLTSALESLRVTP